MAIVINKTVYSIVLYAARHQREPEKIKSAINMINNSFRLIEPKSINDLNTERRFINTYNVLLLLQYYQK